MKSVERLKVTVFGACRVRPLRPCPEEQDVALATFNRVMELAHGKAVIYGPTSLDLFQTELKQKDCAQILLNPEQAQLPGITVVPNLHNAFEAAAGFGDEVVVVCDNVAFLNQMIPLADVLELSILSDVADAGGKLFGLQADWSQERQIIIGAADKPQGWIVRYTRTVNWTRFTCPSNARNEAYRCDLVAINTEQKCPFCAGGKTLLQQEMITENDHWYLSLNAHPLAGAETQYLIIPKRHVESVLELTTEEREALMGILHFVETSYPAGILFSRNGPVPETTGATVLHLHFNYLIPKRGELVTIVVGSKA